MPKFTSNIADYMYSTEKMYEPKNLELMLYDLLKRLNFSETWMIGGCPIDINISRDRPEILSYKTDLKSKSLKYLYPKIAEEWHDTKNENQKPEHFQPGPDIKPGGNVVLVEISTEQVLQNALVASLVRNRPAAQNAV